MPWGSLSMVYLCPFKPIGIFWGPQGLNISLYTRKGHKYTIDKMLQGIICFLLCPDSQKKYVHDIFCELCKCVLQCDPPQYLELINKGLWALCTTTIRLWAWSGRLLKNIPWVMHCSYWSTHQRHNRIPNIGLFPAFTQVDAAQARTVEHMTES